MSRIHNILVPGFVLMQLLVASAASAHAFLHHADPAVGSTVREAPREIVLSFSENTEPAFSTVEVDDATGNRVDLGKITLDADNSSVIHAPLKPLGSGTYKVIWRVVSVDTHRTKGSFFFTLTGR